MEQIASRMLVTKASLYYYFRNKEELLYFAQSASADRLLRLAARAIRVGRDPARRLGLLLEAHVLCLLRELDAAAAHIEFHALPPSKLRRIVAKRDRYEAKVRSLLEQGAARGDLQIADPKLAAMALLGAVNWTVRWYRPDGGRSPEAIARCVARTALGGVLGPARRCPEPTESELARVMQ